VRCSQGFGEDYANPVRAETMSGGARSRLGEWEGDGLVWALFGLFARSAR
jgi:hypothetical protein